MPKHALKTTFSKLPYSEAQIKGEIPADLIAASRAKALRHIGKHADLPGFRKGHVPDAMLVSKLGEVAIIEEAAEIVLQDALLDLLQEHKVSPIGRPQVELTKVAPGNPVEFTLTIAVMPTVKLPDYAKIAAAEMAKKDEAIVVEEKEIDDVIEHIRKTHSEKGHTHDIETGETAHKHDLPEWNEAFVKTLGDFSSIQDFRDKAKENIKKEKVRRNAEKKRAEIISELVNASEIDMPKVLVESELNKMHAQFQDDVERVGMKLEDYLKHIKKSAEDLKKEWRPDAEKRAKVQLIFNQIAVAEKLLPSESDVMKEAQPMMDMYKDANPENIRIYVETMLANEKVLNFLESQKK